jgi:Rrf2 family protein
VDRLLNVSDRTSAAIHALALAARNERGPAPGGALSSKAAAAELRVSASYLAKVLQPLVKAGLLESTRGAAGGFSLGRSAARISALEVFELLDGPLPRRDCLFESSACAKGSCALKELCQKTEAMLREVLSSTSIEAISLSL